MPHRRSGTVTVKRGGTSERSAPRPRADGKASTRAARDLEPRPDPSSRQAVMLRAAFGAPP